MSAINVVVTRDKVNGKEKFICDCEGKFSTVENSGGLACQKMGVRVFGNVLFNYKKIKTIDEKTDIWEIKKIEPKFMGKEINIFEIKPEEPKKSRAADMAKSRATAAGYIRDARLTERAAKSLESLCAEWNMNKTQVINKLLEESEQRQLL